MVNLSLTLLLVLLVLLILLSSFFSGSETGMMALNRYRLRHLARKNNRFAMIVSKLLDRPDRLLGIILIGNTFANIVASAVATVIAARLYGDWGIALGTLLLTLIILIFAEVTPKTLAAAYPQKIAFFAAYPLNWLLKIFYPIVFFVNSIANGILKIFHVPIKTGNLEKLTSEELSTVVTEAGSNIPQIHQDMLVAILRLENVKVEDVMIPRAKAIGIDITLDINTILSKLADAPFTQLPLYAEDINHIKGVIDIHQAFKLLAKNPKLNKSQLLRIAEEPYFIPENAVLHQQLMRFRARKQKLAFVVDEYGDVQGLVTIEDILEEIVGEFTSSTATDASIEKIAENIFLVDAAINLRDLNRRIQTNFSVKGPKTLNGIITEYLENIPNRKMCLYLSGHRIELIDIKHNQVKRVIIYRDK